MLILVQKNDIIIKKTKRGEIVGKKICGIILLVLAGMAIFGGIANGSLVQAYTGARGVGYLFGQLIAYVAMIGGGIALIIKSKKQ